MDAVSSPGDVSHESPPAFPGRCFSIDALRGASVLVMLLVNNVALDAATPDTFLHADWGQTPRLADFVFPVFLLAVGLAIPFARAGHARRGGRLPGWVGHALGRTLGLFAVGCFLDSSLARTPVVGMGVLQLIALAGLVGSLCAPLPPLVRAGLALALGGGYASLLVSEPLSASESATRRITEAWLAPHGLSGLFSVLPTAALVLAGTVAGERLRVADPRPWRRPLLLAAGGTVLASLGWLLADILPMHKAIWTPSYLLWTGGWGIVALGGLALLLDTPPMRRFAAWSWPLRVAGANALFAYAAPIAVKGLILRVWTWHGIALEDALRGACFDRFGRLGGGWVWTVGVVVVWWAVLAVLHIRRIFIRL